MRVKSRGTLEQRSGTAAAPTLDGAPARRFYISGALAALVVATGLAIAMCRFGTALDARRASASSRQCSARYAALLDLAELARRDGKSSEVVVRGLDDKGGVMSGCVSMDNSGPDLKNNGEIDTHARVG